MAKADWREERGLGLAPRAEKYELGNITPGGVWTVQPVAAPTITPIDPPSSLSIDDMIALKRYAEIGLNVLGYLVPDRTSDGFRAPLDYGPVNRLSDELRARQIARDEALALAEKQAEEDAESADEAN